MIRVVNEIASSLLLRFVDKKFEIEFSGSEKEIVSLLGLNISYQRHGWVSSVYIDPSFNLICKSLRNVHRVLRWVGRTVFGSATNIPRATVKYRSTLSMSHRKNDDLHLYWSE